MKISCDIIRDLLPLYTENMTSQASNDLVDEHLMQCDNCRACLDDLRRPTKTPWEVSIHTLSRVKKHIQNRRILTALLAVLLLVSLYVNVQTVLDSYVYLTADQAVQSVELDSDGRIKIYWKNYVSGTASAMLDEAPNNLGVVTQTRLRNALFSEDQDVSRPMILDEQESYFKHYAADPKQTNIWYYNWRDGKPETLLWDAGAEPPAADFTFEPVMNYASAWYCIAAAILSLLATILTWVNRKTRAGKWLRMTALALGCSCVAVLCASGGQFMAVGFSIPDQITDSLLPFIPMFLTGLCAFALHDMKHQEL